MAWLDRLAAEISAQTQSAVSADELYSQFQKFRRNCVDPILRESYPSDMHHFKKSNTPQASTRDIILSFMDQRFPTITTPLVKEIAGRLEKAQRPREAITQLGKVLAKERSRRYAKGPKRPETYWGRNQVRMKAKYAGLYALLRVASNGRLQAEPFAIVPRAGDPTALSVFWRCGPRLRVGDVLLNTYRFSGMTVCKSTDTVIEPVSISLLRAARSTTGGEKQPLVLGGFAVGWKDDDASALLHARIAVIRLNAMGDILDEGSFVRMVSKPGVDTCLAALKEYSSVQENLLPKFLKVRELHMSQLDARNALPDLTHEMVTVLDPT